MVGWSGAFTRSVGVDARPERRSLALPGPCILRRYMPSFLDYVMKTILMCGADYVLIQAQMGPWL